MVEDLITTITNLNCTFSSIQNSFKRWISVLKSMPHIWTISPLRVTFDLIWCKKDENYECHSTMLILWSSGDGWWWVVVGSKEEFKNKHWPYWPRSSQSRIGPHLACKMTRKVVPGQQNPWSEEYALMNSDLNDDFNLCDSKWTDVSQVRLKKKKKLPQTKEQNNLCWSLVEYYDVITDYIP